MARRAVINGAGAPLRFEDYPIPDAPSGLVRVRIQYSGVCHSDLHLRDDDGVSFGVKMRDVIGDDGFKKIVLGHEIAGCIDEIGPDSDAEKYGFKKGDRVAVFPWKGCNACSVCAKGTSNLCNHPALVLFSTGCGPDNPGGYATHVLVLPKFLIKIPENVPGDVAALLTCSGGTAYSAVQKIKAGVEFGASTAKNGLARVLIEGAGGLGLWAIRFVKALYPGKVHVMVAEIDQKKIDLALSNGADEGILWSRDNTNEENADLVKKDGEVHAVLDFIGGPKTMLTGGLSLVRNGKMVVIGLQGGIVQLPLPLLVLKEITLMGNIVFGLNQMHELMAFVSKNNITYPNINYFKLDQANEALDLLEKGQIIGRAVLKQE